MDRLGTSECPAIRYGMGLFLSVESEPESDSEGYDVFLKTLLILNLAMMVLRHLYANRGQGMPLYEVDESTFFFPCYCSG